MFYWIHNSIVTVHFLIMSFYVTFRNLMPFLSFQWKFVLSRLYSISELNKFVISSMVHTYLRIHCLICAWIAVISRMRLSSFKTAATLPSNLFPITLFQAMFTFESVTSHWIIRGILRDFSELLDTIYRSMLSYEILKLACVKIMFFLLSCQIWVNSLQFLSW